MAETFEEHFGRRMELGARMRARLTRMKRRLKPHTKSAKVLRQIQSYEAELRQGHFLAPPIGEHPSFILSDEQIERLEEMFPSGRLLTRYGLLNL